MRSHPMAFAALLLAACGGDDGPSSTIDAGTTIDAPAGAFVIGGTVGPQSTAGSVAVLFVAQGESGGDYLYKFGEGTSVGTTFSATLPGNPPEQARTRFGGGDLGTAFLMLIPPGQTIPDGEVVSDPVVLGLSTMTGLVYRGPTDDGSLWSDSTQFPIGLSCSTCAPTGSGSFKPVDCAALEIDTREDAPGCDFQ